MSVSLKTNSDCNIFLADAVESVALKLIGKFPGLVTFWLWASGFFGESFSLTAGWPAAMTEVKTPDSRRP